MKSLSVLKKELTDKFHENFAKNIGKEYMISDDLLDAFLQELKDNIPQELVEKTQMDRTQQLWELYLAKFLPENGINLKKDIGEGKPDFYFLDNELKINIEAKAPNDASDECEEYKVKPTPLIVTKTGKDAEGIFIEAIEDDRNLDESEQGAGFIVPTNSILRLTNIISYAISQHEKRLDKNRVSPNDANVLAINGTLVIKHLEFKDAINKDAFSPNDIAQSYFGYHLYCVLYGITGQEFYNSEDNSFCYELGQVRKNGEEIPDFSFNETFPFDGVLYDTIDELDLMQERYRKPIYFQNPFGKDLRKIFEKFCTIIDGELI